MLLRWPRSSGGSLRSLTASITPERRSDVFLLTFRLADSPDTDEEAHLSLCLEMERNEDAMVILIPLWS